MKKGFLILIFVSGLLFAGQPGNPKNIIFLIGDGMGVSYVSASVISMKNDQFTRFNSIGFQVTCSADKLVTDSAASGTALATGNKTANGIIGMDPDSNVFKNVREYAEEAGKFTGVVSTSSITHATPASFVGHVIKRSMENKIAEQFISSGIEVAIGAGKKFFLPELREDDVNVADSMKNLGYTLYYDFDKLKSARDDKIIGLLEDKALPRGDDRDYTLGELTGKALEVLSKGDKGFFLMVEGSQIDWAGHNNDEDYAKSEQKDFNTAIKTALDFAEKDGNTLVIVTADHETGGMALTGGDRDDIDFDFVSKHHTASMIPVFAKGPGEEKFTGIYENTEIGKKLIDFVSAK